MKRPPECPPIKSDDSSVSTVRPCSRRRIPTTTILAVGSPKSDAGETPAATAAGTAAPRLSKSSLPAGLDRPALAMHALGVFENLNAGPPGVLATLGLLALHGAGLLAALIVFAALILHRSGPGAG